MKWLILIILLLVPCLSQAKITIVDIIANHNYFDLKQGVIPNHIKTTKSSSAIYDKNNTFFLSEYSGIGNIPRNLGTQIKSSSLLYTDFLFLWANKIWGAKTQDFLLNLDYATLQFFTIHPWQKFYQVDALIAKLNPKEELVIHTTTWTTGLDLYEAVLKKYKFLKVNFIVRDLALTNTIFKTSESRKENIKYVIYDDSSCEEKFNVLSQLEHYNSRKEFLKDNKYIKTNFSSIQKKSKQQLKNYRATQNCN